MLTTDMVPSNTPLDELGVHLIGDFSGQTALCQSGRDLIETVHFLQIPCQILDLPLDPGRMPPSSKFDLSDVNYTPPRSPLSIISWNGDAYPIIGQNMPFELFANRRIVGVWYWETEQELPKSHRKGYDWVDEVWVASQFVADSLSRFAPVPVHKFPHLVKPLTVPDHPELPEALQNDRFVFLFSFDYRSVSRRKNPEAVCESFTRAFPSSSPNGPLCVIKSISGRSHHELEWLELNFRYRNQPEIIFIDGWMSLSQRNSLMARANCYVSLHRAEGLGLTLMESMSLGKPCIATGYSGNLEFMSPENSWLIPYQTVTVGEGAWPYPPTHTWAEADITAAANAMQEVYAKPELAEKKGRLGQMTIRNNHSIEAVAVRFLELITQAVTEPIRPKKNVLLHAASGSGQRESHNQDDHLPGSSSKPRGRGKAYQLIKEAKALEKAARQQRKALPSSKVPPNVESYLQTLEQLIRIQSKIHSETLYDLGEIKTRLRNYHGGTLDALVRDRDLIKSILLNITRSILNESNPPSNT